MHKRKSGEGTLVCLLGPLYDTLVTIWLDLCCQIRLFLKDFLVVVSGNSYNDYSLFGVKILGVMP